MKRNRQLRAYFIMRKIAKRMTIKMENNNVVQAEFLNDDIDHMVEIRNQYFDHVGRVDDYIRRFDLLSIIV